MFARSTLRTGALLSLAFASLIAASPSTDACPPKDAVPATPHRAAAKDRSAAIPAAWKRLVASRRPADDSPVILSFKDTPVDEVLGFIVESTGKPIMTRLPIVSQFKITVFEDRPIPRSQCLDRVYEAMANSGLAVIEDEEVVWLDLLTDLLRSPRLPLAVTADEDVDGIPCNGLITFVVLQLQDARAFDVVDQIDAFVPDFATKVFDDDRNQLLVLSTVGSAKQIRRAAEALGGVAMVDEAGLAEGWTRVPTEINDDRFRRSREGRWRDPLTDEQVSLMDRSELAQALADVARARLRSDLSDEVRAQYEREHETLLLRLKELVSTR